MKQSNHVFIKLRNSFSVYPVLLFLFVLLLSSCQSEEETVTESESYTEIFKENFYETLSAEEKELYDTQMSDVSYESHTDHDYFDNETERVGALQASYSISRRYLGLPYHAQNGPTCQSHAAAMALDAWWQKRNDNDPNYSEGVDGRPFDWKRSPYFVKWCMQGNPWDALLYFSLPAALNSVKYHGATHLVCMPDEGVWAPDPTFGLNSWEDVYWNARNNLSLWNNSANWAWIAGSNESAIPAIRPSNNRLNLDQIKAAVSNDEPVLIRFALVNGGTSSGTNVNPNNHVMDEPNTNNTHLALWHVVLIIGYNDDSQRFYCQNSWGTNSSGMNAGGCYYMTYETVRHRADQAAYIMN